MPERDAVTGGGAAPTAAQLSAHSATATAAAAAARSRDLSKQKHSENESARRARLRAKFQALAALLDEVEHDQQHHQSGDESPPSATAAAAAAAGGGASGRRGAGGASADSRMQTLSAAIVALQSSRDKIDKLEAKVAQLQLQAQQAQAQATAAHAAAAAATAVSPMANAGTVHLPRALSSPSMHPPVMPGGGGGGASHQGRLSIDALPHNFSHMHLPSHLAHSQHSPIPVSMGPSGSGVHPLVAARKRSSSGAQVWAAGVQEHAADPNSSHHLPHPSLLRDSSGHTDASHSSVASSSGTASSAPKRRRTYGEGEILAVHANGNMHGMIMHSPHSSSASSPHQSGAHTPLPQHQQQQQHHPQLMHTPQQQQQQLAQATHMMHHAGFASARSRSSSHHMLPPSVAPLSTYPLLASQACFFLGLDGALLDVSTPLLHLLGYARPNGGEAEEATARRAVLSQSVFALLHPSELKATLSIMKNSLIGGQQYQAAAATAAAQGGGLHSHVHGHAYSSHASHAHGPQHSRSPSSSGMSVCSSTVVSPTGVGSSSSSAVAEHHHPHATDVSLCRGIEDVTKVFLRAAFAGLSPLPPPMIVNANAAHAQQHNNTNNPLSPPTHSRAPSLGSSGTGTGSSVPGQQQQVQGVLPLRLVLFSVAHPTTHALSMLFGLVVPLGASSSSSSSSPTAATAELSQGAGCEVPTSPTTTTTIAAHTSSSSAAAAATSKASFGAPANFPYGVVACLAEVARECAELLDSEQQRYLVAVLYGTPKSKLNPAGAAADAAAAAAAASAAVSSSSAAGTPAAGSTPQGSVRSLITSPTAAHLYQQQIAAHFRSGQQHPHPHPYPHPHQIQLQQHHQLQYAHQQQLHPLPSPLHQLRLTHSISGGHHGLDVHHATMPGLAPPTFFHASASASPPPQHPPPPHSQLVHSRTEPDVHMLMQHHQQQQHMHLQHQQQQQHHLPSQQPPQAHHQPQQSQLHHHPSQQQTQLHLHLHQVLPAEHGGAHGLVSPSYAPAPVYASMLSPALPHAGNPAMASALRSSLPLGGGGDVDEDVEEQDTLPPLFASPELAHVMSTQSHNSNAVVRNDDVGASLFPTDDDLATPSNAAGAVGVGLEAGATGGNQEDDAQDNLLPPFTPALANLRSLSSQPGVGGNANGTGVDALTPLDSGLFGNGGRSGSNVSGASFLEDAAGTGTAVGSSGMVDGGLDPVEPHEQDDSDMDGGTF